MCLRPSVYVCMHACTVYMNECMNVRMYVQYMDMYVCTCV